MASLQILDFFGLPGRGGSLTLQCHWRIDPELAERAGGEPIRLACHVRDESGQLILHDGPRSLPISAAEREHALGVPLALPTRPGVYQVEIDPVVEHRFWASWFGLEPAVLHVERLPGGDLIGLDPRSGRRFAVRWPVSPTGQPFRIPHALYGMDDSERAVEIPWALTRYHGERRVVDVGYAHAEPRYRAALAELRVPMLVGLDLVAAPRPEIRAVVGDARQPGLRPGSIDLILAISVIEHIGRDNTGYLRAGTADPREPDGDLNAIAALAALLAPGGRLLVTVPFGVSEDHGWFIQYDTARLENLIDASGLALVEAEFYRYRRAWEGPCAPDLLANCRYGDGAVAATGLACLTLSRAGGSVGR